MSHQHNVRHPDMFDRNCRSVLGQRLYPHNSLRKDSCLRDKDTVLSHSSLLWSRPDRNFRNGMYCLTKKHRSLHKESVPHRSHKHQIDNSGTQDNHCRRYRSEELLCCWGRHSKRAQAPKQTEPNTNEVVKLSSRSLKFQDRWAYNDDNGDRNSWCPTMAHWHVPCLQDWPCGQH